MIGSIPSNGNISSNINNVTVLGGVYPIYDGGIRDARIYEARSRASAAEATLLRLQQNAATEIVAADDALRSSLNGLSTFRDTVMGKLSAADASVLEPLQQIVQKTQKELKR